MDFKIEILIMNPMEKFGGQWSCFFLESPLCGNLENF